MPNIIRRFTDFSHESIPWLFVLAGIVFGLPYALFVGPLHVPDEGGHFYRAYRTSRGSCKGVPGILAALDIRQQDRMPWVELPPGTTGPELVKLIDSPQGSRARRPALLRILPKGHGDAVKPATRQSPPHQGGKISANRPRKRLTADRLVR